MRARAHSRSLPRGGVSVHTCAGATVHTHPVYEADSNQDDHGYDKEKPITIKSQMGDFLWK